MEALFHDLFRCPCKVLWRPLGSIPAVGIAQNRFPNLSSEELINRYAQRLAEDIPKGNFDSGYRSSVDMPRVDRHALHQTGRQRIDLKRVLPDGKMFQLTDRGFGRSNKAIESAFPDAMQTAIGMNSHKEPILPTG